MCWRFCWPASWASWLLISDDSFGSVRCAARWLRRGNRHRVRDRPGREVGQVARGEQLMEELMSWVAWGFACGLTLGGIRAILKRL